jgi:hypothetical protein
MIISRTRGNGPAIGAYSEAIALTAFLNQGWELARPLIEVKAYDLLIKRSNNPWETVQIKTASKHPRGGINSCSLIIRINRRGQRKSTYDENAFDLLAAVDPEQKRVWLIPWACVDKLASHILMRVFEELELKDDMPFVMPSKDKILKSAKEKKNQASSRILADEEVKEILKLHQNGSSNAKIADTLAVSDTTVARIVRGESYLWIQR